MRDKQELKEFLEEKYIKYNTTDFIEDDPVSIPHMFSNKEDIEIAGFLTATIAWGQRKTILANAYKLVEWMDFSPYEFILNAGRSDLHPFENFVHRTFNGIDCVFFIKSLQNIYNKHGGLENAFNRPGNSDMKEHIMHFRDLFFQPSHPDRTRKHVANPAKGASAKRINMFLRWMIRNDVSGVDFGLWKKHHSSQLYCPLDVHSGSVARKLSLLQRKQNDWKAVEELTASLRMFDASDPVKYDFALFGLGIDEKF